MPAAKGCEIVYREPEPMTSPRVNRNLNRGFLIRVESVIELWYNKCWINCTKCMCYIHVWIILGTLIKIYTFITGWHELIIRVSRTRAFIYHVYAIEDILRLVKLISGNLAAGNTVSDWLGDCEWGFPGTGSQIDWSLDCFTTPYVCFVCKYRAVSIYRGHVFHGTQNGHTMARQPGPYMVYLLCVQSLS